MGKGQLIGLLLRDKLGAGGFQIFDLGGQSHAFSQGGIALGQKACNALFKRSDRRIPIGKRARLFVDLAGQRGNQSGLTVAFDLQRRKIVFQIGGFLLRHTERLAERGDLVRQLIELAFLPSDRFTQHALNDHKNGQNEHQYQQKRCHRIHESGPDRAVHTLDRSPGKRHGSAPVRAATSH